VTHFVTNYGLWVVVVLVFLETAGGPFIPGETAYIVAAALAGQGHGSIGALIPATVAAAVAGTSAGYLLGRSRFGRLVSRVPRIERTEQLFRRHGAKALYLGRFLPVIRATLGWMAGVVGMPWPRFLGWNVAGSASWGAVVGVASYYLGTAVERGITIGGVVVVAFVGALVGLHLVRRRLERA
jgi:membrane-associated protein